MSEIKVNKISPRTACGTTTLGDSGDTFTIPAGVTITNSGTAAGFGATGAASWDTTVKTTGFTAVSGVGYFVNTTAGAITVTLPLSPAAGAVVAVSDYAGTADTNAITIGRNGSNINGAAADLIFAQENSAITLVYVDGTQGWKATDTSSLSDVELEPTYVTATGGTITESGDYKIHTFTGPGTFCVSALGNPIGGPNSVDYMVVAGGGSGSGSDNGVRGGAGGAGGFRESSGTATGSYTASPLGACVSALPVSVTGYPITVGGGAPTPGPAVPINSPSGKGTSGSNSTFSTITSTGGGGGTTLSAGAAGTGGSGGGGGTSADAAERAGAAGNTPPVSPAQGFAGGNATPYTGAPLCSSGGGGGGATAVGAAGSGPTGGDGGAGATTSINGTPTAFAGGGGGGGGVGNNGAGGAGGGGAGGATDGGSGNDAGTAGTVNTGGGGGGGSARMNPAPSNPNVPGSAGGSGIVIIRYKFQN